MLKNPEKEDLQDKLFPIPYDWEEEWKDMPEYHNWQEADPQITATFKFRNEEDFQRFKKIISEHGYDGAKVFDGEQSLTKKQAWFPHNEQPRFYRYKSKEQMNPKYPIYIVSKGRYDINPTSRALIRMGVPFRMVVEEQEYQQYCNLVGKENVLILPKRYQEQYDTFWKDDDPRVGPGSARNFAWEHSIEEGFDYHWVLDDNIDGFRRFNQNMQIWCENGFVFSLTEKFVERYENLAQAGFQYDKFIPTKDLRPPYTLNTRIYSCLLIKNDIPFRWRGRYNEDTDLSLRILKSGLCTIQMNAFLQDKKTTTKMKGGNTDEFYDEEGTKNKSQMLKDMHPDLVELSDRFNRHHHFVDYSPFKKNKLIKKKNIDIKDGINEYGIELVKI